MAKNRKKSKIVIPESMKQAKAGLVAFRPSKDLARYLKGKNKTEFIERALRLAISEEHQMDCPTCKGTGKIGKV